MWGYNYFRPLIGFPEVAARYQDIVRQALHQKDAGARAYALTALSALEIPIAPYIEEIAELAVSGSKEVRENAAPIVQGAVAEFRPLLERHAAVGNSDERYHAVRLVGRTGGEEARAFLAERLAAERSAKVVDAIKELLAEAKPACSPGVRHGEGEFGLAPVPEVPVHAPLDEQVRADLRARIDEFERRSAEAFARNKFAQTRGMTRAPISPDTADNTIYSVPPTLPCIDIISSKNGENKRSCGEGATLSADPRLSKSLSSDFGRVWDSRLRSRGVVVPTKL
jgi:hypothetical protein